MSDTIRYTLTFEEIQKGLWKTRRPLSRLVPQTVILLVLGLPSLWYAVIKGGDTGSLLLGIALPLLAALGWILPAVSFRREAQKLVSEGFSVTLTVTETAVVAAHTKTEYEIPLEQIEAVELITERPSIGRQWGTGMDTVQKGMYSSPWGSIRVCIDPRSGPWVLVTTKSSGKYLLGATGGVAWPYGAARIELPAAG